MVGPTPYLGVLLEDGRKVRVDPDLLRREDAVGVLLREQWRRAGGGGGGRGGGGGGGEKEKWAVREELTPKLDRPPGKKLTDDRRARAGGGEKRLLNDERSMMDGGVAGADHGAGETVGRVFAC